MDITLVQSNDLFIRFVVTPERQEVLATKYTEITFAALDAPLFEVGETLRKLAELCENHNELALVCFKFGQISAKSHQQVNTN